MMSVTEELIRNIARVTRCSEQELTPETELKTIKADSLHWVQIIVGLESALDIEVEIDREKMSELSTVAEFAEYVEQFCQQNWATSTTVSCTDFRAAALLGRLEEAHKYYAETLKVATDMMFPPKLALTQLQLAELLLEH